MKPPPFSYHDPDTVDEAVGLLSRLENAKLLAGGQSLMPMLNFRYVLPDHLIDLNKIAALSYLREDGDVLELGGMTRQRDIEFSDLVKARYPIIHEAILNVGHRQTRNRGTIGGSLCHLDPSAELVTMAAAHDAVVTVAGPGGTRQVPFADFPVAFMTTALEPNEILTSVRFPRWPAGHGYGFVEFARRHGDFAIASAAVLLDVGANGKITRASMTLGGVSVKPVRMHEIEKKLIGEIPSEDLFRELCEECRKVDAIEDVHAPASYRQHLATVMSRRAAVAAMGRVGRA
ncbi:MAG TPA: xanthine dehydrogenase family protein subunit M [Micropepsaceae bacterium]|jgi:carbon-monoxide dehydrogenase medium subunit|nr:xanthine dehydrogenase family protein subunit M [Micropepsaceae bacterium]